MAPPDETPEPGLRTPEQLFLDHLALIERLVAHAGRKHGLDPAEVEDFAGEIKLKLIADDYAVVRRFSGRCRFSTYLVTVIQHALLDHVNQRWGRFRPSIPAKRLGGAAVALEALVYRDGLSVSEAIEVLARRPGATSRAELEALAERLPSRSRRARPAALGNHDVAAPQRADERVLEAERQREWARIELSLRRALEPLAPEDRLLVQWRVHDGLRVSDIARALGQDAKPLYRRLETLFRDLRRRLEAQGVSEADVAEVLGSPALVADSETNLPPLAVPRGVN